MQHNHCQYILLFPQLSHTCLFTVGPTPLKSSSMCGSSGEHGLWSHLPGFTQQFQQKVNSPQVNTSNLLVYSNSSSLDGHSIGLLPQMQACCNTGHPKNNQPWFCSTPSLASLPSKLYSGPILCSLQKQNSSKNYLNM